MIVRVEIPNSVGPELDRLRALVADTNMTMTIEDAHSREYYNAHLAFARAGIVEAAANREPLLDLLLAFQRDVAVAERVVGSS